MSSALSERSPAVSEKRIAIPFSANGVSITSRVVPATADTIASSRLANALISVDLPAFGGPAITTDNPSEITSAAGRTSHCSNSCARSVIPATNFRVTTSPTSTSSSSAKFSSASAPAISVSSWPCHAATARDTCPLAMPSACTRWLSVSAASKSAKPSASARSIRPFTNARRVNSPASARRNPGISASAASTAITTARPPCRWSSAKSSPVAVAGPGNQRINARSSGSPTLVLSSASVARRAAGNRPASACNAAPACAPLTRTTAIAAGGIPLDRAKIVSFTLS